MSFWDLSDGGTAKDTGNEFEVPSGNIEPIPDNSSVLAQIEEIKWASKQTGEKYIEAKWNVLGPESLANRKVFQKIWVTDLDPSAKSEEKAIQKRDKARRMLAGIDSNAGGRLMESGAEPTDDSMALALCNRPMVIKVMLWEMPDRERHGEFIRGNWIAGVSPKTHALSVGESKPAPKSPAQSQQASQSFNLDDEIPF